MALDNFKNNSKVTVSLGYDAVATSIVLQAGDAAKLPTAPFNAEWWDSTTYTDPTDDPNKEIIRVTTVTSSNDTLTIARAAETSAFTHNTAGKVYKLIAGLTAKSLNTDIPATFTAYNATMTTSGGIAYVTGSGAITEDATNLFWDGTNVGVGTNTMAGKIHAVNTGSGAGVSIVADGYSNLAQVLLRRANGSGGGPTALSSGDLVARYGMQGYNGSVFTARKAAIEMNAAENWGTASNGAYISIQTTPKGSTTIAEVVRITDAGAVGIGTATPGGQLHVVGGNVLVDSTGNPQYRVLTTGTLQASVGCPTAAGQMIADSGVNDLCIRGGLAQANSFLESVDGGVSVRRLVRPFKSLTNNTATTVFSLTCANNSVAIVRLSVASECTNGTDVQSAFDVWVINVINKAGVVTAVPTAVTGESTVQNSGGTTLARTISTSAANPCVVQLNINSNLTSITAGYPRVTMTIENFTRQAIGPA
jgi:hypothetical protein